jgi:hypothetical protein
VQEDVFKECEKDIVDQLIAYAMPKIKRRIVAGLPEWYKDELLKRQFAANDAEVDASLAAPVAEAA